MLSTNCILVKTFVKYDLYRSYGIASTSSIGTDIKIVAAYQWLLTRAYDCLDDCQIKRINKVLYGLSIGEVDESCADTTIVCLPITVDDVTPSTIPSTCSTLQITITN